MKNGNTRKNSAIPTESPKSISLKPKKARVRISVARAREGIQRVEPTPQPKIGARKTNEKRRALGEEWVKGRGVEPAPQPSFRIRKGGALKSQGERDFVAADGGLKERKAPRIGHTPGPGGSSDAPIPSVGVSERDVVSMPEPIVRAAIAQVTDVPGISPKQIPASASIPNKVSPPQVSATLQKAKAASETGHRGRVVRQPRPVPVEIPPILLEPDHVPNEATISGPGARFALTTETETAAAGAPEELPESYGTRQIFLAARDPYCLFASWDLNATQRARYNAASASGALTVRLRRGFVEGPIHLEVHTLPNARDRFIEVAQPDTTFVAELGYHEKNSGLWRSISVSKPVTTPRDRMAPALAPATATATPMAEAPVAPLPEPEPPGAVSRSWQAPSEPAMRFESEPRAEEPVFGIQAQPPETPRWAAKQEPEPIPELPWAPPKEKPRWAPPRRLAAPKWSPSKTKQLEELISLEVRRRQEGSLEIEEVLRGRILRERESEAPSSLELLEEELPPVELVLEAPGFAQAAPSSLEAAAPTAETRKGFWFKVNAELIIYGSTEPDAQVSIGGRTIRLRPDGTFSYRFALPDGVYELPVVAVARDGHDGRAAELRFSRASIYRGDVRPHPQNPALKKPAVDNL